MARVFVQGQGPTDGIEGRDSACVCWPQLVRLLNTQKHENDNKAMQRENTSELN